MSAHRVTSGASAGPDSRDRKTDDLGGVGRRADDSDVGRVCALAEKAQGRGITLLSLLLIGLVLLYLPTLYGCDGDEQGGDAATTSSSTPSDGSKSGDIEGQVGEALEVGSALMTVRALQATFQPALPAQRLSEQSPTAPEAGESFYQAYVRVENRGTDPIRVDPNDFACAIGDTVASVEPTRSGPVPRSLLKNASLDLLLTFKGPAGYEPLLLYDPPWYRGTVRVSPQAMDEDTDTTS